MRKLILIFFAIVMVAGFSNKVMAQATATATATATIVTPISISKTTDMNFGNVAVTGTAGTVILAPAGGRTTTGGATLPTVTGTVSQAVFTVGGQGDYTFTITLPGTVELNDGASHTMDVDNFTSNGTGGTGTLSSGSFTLNVGATLNVSPSQTAGTYTNTTDLDVTVNYN